MFSIKVCRLNLRNTSFRVCSISRLNESTDLNHSSYLTNLSNSNLNSKSNSKFYHSDFKSSYQSFSSKSNFNQNFHSTALKFVLLGSAFTTFGYLFFRSKDLCEPVLAKEAELDQDELAKQYGNYDKRFKTITDDELSRHNCKENRIYVAFKEGVYDITEFVDQHPGGEVILMAAGKYL